MTPNLLYWNECKTMATLQYGMNLGRQQIYNMK